MDRSRYQVSDLDHVHFYWENNQLDVEAVFKTQFSTTAFDNMELRDSAANHILLDGEEDKKNSPPTTPVSESSTQPPALLRSRSFGTGTENVPD